MPPAKKAQPSYQLPDDLCDCKIGRVSEKYDLATISSEIKTLWTSSEESKSLRELAAYFNHKVLRSAMTAAGLNPLAGEIENIYRLLTDPEVSAGNQTQTRNRLSQHGITVDELIADFVSYQTINRHLKECLNIESPASSSDIGLSVEEATQRIQALQNRTASVTTKTLDQLQRHGTVPDTDIEVLVDITVYCNDCQQSFGLVDYLTDPGCHCQ